MINVIGNHIYILPKNIWVSSKDFADTISKNFASLQSLDAIKELKQMNAFFYQHNDGSYTIKGGSK